MLATIALTLALQDAGPSSIPKFPRTGERPIVVRVLVLNYDPKVPSEGNKRLHQVFNWQDPRELSKGYIADVAEVSDGFIQYRITEWKDLDEFPVKTDGFSYTVENYVKAMREGKGFHEPDGTDYEKELQAKGVIERIDGKKIDEVWLFGGPYFGYWEAAMAGPGAYFINGGVYDKFPSKTRFAIMGFNYERGVAEMLHDLSHRTECTMHRVYGRWEAGLPTNPWEQFSAYEKTSPRHTAVGNCHFPPNAEKDYDYANPRTVMSSADDWLNYPKLTGVQKPVNKDTWGGPDYHRNYMKWWFNRLPRKAGVGEDGRQYNWWKYIFDFNAYDERGNPIAQK